MDTTKTMREICGGEPLFETFLQSKGFPFSLENPVVDVVTFDDVCQLRQLNQKEFLAEFKEYKQQQGS